MIRILHDPLNRLIGLAATESRGRYIIGLAGYPGSGKTTIAKKWEAELKRRFGEGAFVVVGMDGFHLSRAELAEFPDPKTAMSRRGAPHTFNPIAFVAKLSELKSSAGSREVGWPGFEHDVGDPVDDALTVPMNCRLVLVEGIYTLMRKGPWSELDDFFDELWFLDTPLETSMERLYSRHQQAWGMTPEQARKQADGNDRLNCAYITPCRDDADFVIMPE